MSVTIHVDDAVAGPAAAAAHATNISLDEYVKLALAEKLAAEGQADTDRGT